MRKNKIRLFTGKESRIEIAPCRYGASGTMRTVRCDRYGANGTVSEPKYTGSEKMYVRKGSLADKQIVRIKPESVSLLSNAKTESKGIFFANK